MDDLKIKKTDFKEEHLTVDTLETAPEWFERFEDQMAMVGLSMTVDTGPSVEEQVKKARVKANVRPRQNSKQGRRLKRLPKRTGRQSKGLR